MAPPDKGKYKCTTGSNAESSSSSTPVVLALIHNYHQLSIQHRRRLQHQQPAFKEMAHVAQGQPVKMFTACQQKANNASHPQYLPGIRCPTCRESGKEVWVLPGKECGYCGTPCG
ncbi:hypothetical protein BN1708_010604 [Verticillium longisporum]|nr:hypothetical protein BN1708_010604 [Verticillium longisporum]